MKRKTLIKVGLALGAVLLLSSWLCIVSAKKLPNVLILGDSISIGYTPFVKEALKDIANVSRPMKENGKNENCEGTLNGVKHIGRWLKCTKWDVIHFNFGLHDLKHVDPVTGKNSNNPNHPLQSDLKQYRKNLSKIIERLKKTKAKLIFATTTPYPDTLKNAIRDPKMYEAYNKVALQIMREHNIEVNDLNAFVLPRMKEVQLPNNVHFTREGSMALAEVVAKAIQTKI